MIATHAIRSTDELFHFHPRSTNPELWRTTVPLIVRERCRRHKGLIATWTAIHWLIVLHAASGRAHFGMREIAEEAGVGRNELAGPGGYIQKLVGLGLIRIVGYKAFKGLREPRPVYHIDHVELERLSLEIVPAVLRDHNIDRPPPAAPDPRQLRLALVPTDDGAAIDRDAPGLQPSMRQSGTANAPSNNSPTTCRPCYPDTGTDHPAPVSARLDPASVQSGASPAMGTVMQPRVHLDSGQLHATVPDMLHPTHQTPGSGTELHAAVPAHACDRDVERENERKNEGTSQPLTPNVLQSIITQITQAVLCTLQSKGSPMLIDIPAELSIIPPAPNGAEPLSAPILSLWQGDQPTLRRRDAHQLALLAAEYDRSTGGYGAYWLGRAILMADLCLSDRDQPIAIAYVRRMLRRWREEGSWGSDRELADAHPRSAAETAAYPMPTASPPPAARQHPAVRAYIETLHETPNTVQETQIAETVTNLDAWRQVLTAWQLNGWGERSVGKMLDRYQKIIAPTQASEPPPSVATIHTYPGISPEQRDRWIRTFHAAATPAEKRAVIARLTQEYPVAQPEQENRS